MDKSEFYVRLETALASFDFSPTVTAVKMMQSSRRVPAFIGANISGTQMSMDFEAQFQAMRDLCVSLAFNFTMGQPTVACVLDADSLTANDMRFVTDTAKDCLSRCTQYTLRRKRVWWSRHDEQAGGLFGILLFVFFESRNAANFTHAIQGECRHRDRRKILVVRPWAIDVASRQIVPDRESWLNNLWALKPGKLSQCLFEDT